MQEGARSSKLWYTGGATAVRLAIMPHASAMGTSSRVALFKHERQSGCGGGPNRKIGSADQESGLRWGKERCERKFEWRNEARWNIVDLGE